MAPTKDNRSSRQKDVDDTRLVRLRKFNIVKEQARIQTALKKQLLMLARNEKLRFKKEAESYTNLTFDNCEQLLPQWDKLLRELKFNLHFGSYKPLESKKVD